MTWMQSEFPFGDPTISTVQERVSDLHLAKAAVERSVSAKFALFIRDIDHERSILLISPEVSPRVETLPGSWVAGEPGDHVWSLLYGDARSAELLGVNRAAR